MALPVKDIHATLKPIGYEQLTSLSSAATLNVPDDAIFALLRAETQDVRWRDDGVNPTASVGMTLTVNDAPYLYVGNLSKVRFIEVTASAKLNVSYYK